MWTAGNTRGFQVPAESVDLHISESKEDGVWGTALGGTKGQNC